MDAAVQEQVPDGEWIGYKYRKAHPILRWLPSKLAEWIGDNYGPELGIPPRRHPDAWTVGELNGILDNNLVAGTQGHLRTFGCIQWESELFNGRPKARCYPFDLPKHRFRGANRKVYIMNSYTNSYMNHSHFLLQDCVCLIAPFPYNPNLPTDFDLQRDFDMSGENLLWYGKLQLLFRCTLCPTGAQKNVRRHQEVSLAFFSTFEPISLTPDSIMQRQGVPMLYDSASCAAIPCLYICHCKNILGRVPLMPCFVAGNSQNTIPHRFSRQVRRGLADSRHNSGNGSRLYEVNLWMWRYGRGQARMDTVLQAMEVRAKRLREARVRAGETAKRRRTMQAAAVARQ